MSNFYRAMARHRKLFLTEQDGPYYCHFCQLPIQVLDGLSSIALVVLVNRGRDSKGRFSSTLES